MAEQIEIADEMKEILEDKAPAAPAPEDPKPVEAEKPAEAKDEAAEDQDERRNRVSAKDRIRQFRRKLGDTERELEAARQEIEKLRASTKPESTEPKEEDFPSQAEWLEAVVDYRAEQKAKAALKAKETEAAEARSKQTAAQIQADWNKKQAKALEKYPDFKEMENDLIEDIQDLGASNLFEEILESDQGTELVAYFHKNPDELERVAALRPRAATREIGKIESKLAEKPARKSPPPPPETIRGSALVTKDISRMSQAEYNKYMNERMR